MPEQLAPELVAGAIIENGIGEILLIRQRKWADQYSCFVGGHIRPNETVLQALLREVEEEVGINLDPESVRPIGWAEEVVAPPVYHRRAHLIFLNALCRTESSKLQFDIEREVQTALWVMPEVALSMVMERNTSTLRALLAEGRIGGVGHSRQP